MRDAQDWFTRFLKTLLQVGVFASLAMVWAQGQNNVYQLVKPDVPGTGVDLPMGLNNMGDELVYDPSVNHSDFFYDDYYNFNAAPGYAVAINNREMSVGWYQVNGQTHGDLSAPYAFYDVGTLGGSSSWAYGINDNNEVVGASVTSAGKTHAFLYHGLNRGNPLLIDLGAFAGGYSEARGINYSGYIIGDSTTVTNQKFHAFITLLGGSLRDLGTLGGTDSYGMAINDANQAVGYSYTAGNAAIHPFLYTTAMQDLGSLGGTASEATAINNFGQIVGWSYTTNNAAKHAWIYNGSSLVDLNTIVPNLNGWTLNSAWAINDRGEIGGYATSSLGTQQVYRLEPVLASNCVPNTYATQFLDLTGDGRADQIIVNDNGILVQRANPNGSGPLGLPSFGPLTEVWSKVPFYGVYHKDGVTVGNITFAALTGFSTKDAIVVNDTGVIVHRNMGTYFRQLDETWFTGLLPASYHVSGVAHPNIAFLDMDGDGKADAVTIDDNGVWVYKSNGYNFSTTGTNWTGSAFYGTRGTYFADVNGDGWPDVIAVSTDYLGRIVMTVRLNNNGNGFLAAQSWGALGYIPSALADMNGDGLFDQIVNRGSSGISVGLSNGAAFNGLKHTWTAPAFYGTFGTYYADVDNDPNYPGAADVIALNPGQVLVERSTGYSLNAAENWSTLFALSGNHDPICH